MNWILKPAVGRASLAKLPGLREKSTNLRCFPVGLAKWDACEQIYPAPEFLKRAIPQWDKGLLPTKDTKEHEIALSHSRILVRFVG